MLQQLSKVISHVACPQWEEEAALHRDHAAKQAELAAAELSKLSSRMAQQQQQQQQGGKGAAAAAGGSAWGLRYIVELLTSFLLNRLQLSVSNVHVFLKAPGGKDRSRCSVVGLRVGGVSTAADLRSLPPPLVPIFAQGSSQRPSATRVVRHVMLKQLQLYWQCDGVAGARQRPPPDGSPESVLGPLDCAVRLSLSPTGPSSAAASFYSSGGSHQPAPHFPLEVLLATQLLQLRINSRQLVSALELADDAEVWSRRNRYGRFRPPGWRTAWERRSSRNAALIGGASLSSFGGSLPAAVRRTGSLGGAQQGPSSAMPLVPSRSFPGLHGMPLREVAVPAEGAGGVSGDLPPGPSSPSFRVPDAAGGSRQDIPSAAAGSAAAVTWRDVWRYAGRAVLFDIRMRRRSTNAPRYDSCYPETLTARLLTSDAMLREPLCISGSFMSLGRCDACTSICTSSASTTCMLCITTLEVSQTRPLRLCRILARLK